MIPARGANPCWQPSQEIGHTNYLLTPSGQNSTKLTTITQLIDFGKRVEVMYTSVHISDLQC